MPLWVELYLLIVLGIGVMSVWHNIKERRPPWYILINAVNECLILLVGTAYWIAPLGQLVAPLALIFFIMGVAWLPIEFKTELTSDSLKNPELSATGNLVAATCAVLFGMALFAPLYYWGFLFAVQGLNAPIQG